MDDFKVLEKIVNKELDIKNIDIETKKRLIKLCLKQIENMNSKLEKIEDNIEKKKKILEILKKI